MKHIFALMVIMSLVMVAVGLAFVTGLEWERKVHTCEVTPDYTTKSYTDDGVTVSWEYVDNLGSRG